MNSAVPFAAGLSLGAAAAWLACRALYAARLDAASAGREAELVGRFAALSADALRQNNAAFLQLARTELERSQAEGAHALALKEQAIGELLAPLKRDLERYDAKVEKMDRGSAEALSALAERLAHVDAASTRLGAETANLVKALRAPQVRGRWGEMQLRRVVEMAGMVDHCDFTEQHTVSTDDGRLRPDMVVRLPGGKTVVVDAKAPLGAYLDAAECSEDAVRAARLLQHAAQVRAHVDGLSRKAYWDQFAQSPEFVVLFLPGEAFFSAALEQDPSLIELGVEKKVIIATPTTLIALLRAVAYGWRTERAAEHAEEIGRVGRELYGRLATLGEHVTDMGRGLERAVASYNRAVGSLESRVLVSARRFRDMGAAGGEEIPTVAPVDTVPRALQAPELVPERAELPAELPPRPSLPS